MGEPVFDPFNPNAWLADGWYCEQQATRFYMRNDTVGVLLKSPPPFLPGADRSE